MKKHEKDDMMHLRMSLKMITKLQSTVSSMERDSNTLGAITFKMSEYSKIKNETFYSEPFYTSPGGYKLCIRVDPIGNGKARGIYISIFLKLLEGPNDESLHWPFLGTVVIELLNQIADSNHHHETFTVQDKDAAIIGNELGLSNFIRHLNLSHDSTRNTQYLMDDTLYFRATVEVKEHKPWLHCTHSTQSV